MGVVTMRPTKVRVSLGLTIPLVEDFSNMKPEIELEAELDPGEDFEAVSNDLFRQAQALFAGHALSLQDTCGPMKSTFRNLLSNALAKG
jgi:hypothetical protein